MSDNEFIKSHSNYVLKKKHQLVNDGSIYERDITTINGLNQFFPGQNIYYNSNNFIITINSDEEHLKDLQFDDFKSWNLESLEEAEPIEQPKKISIKHNFNKLKDFAYYGSCVELIRSSIIDIISKYPGELYVPIINNEHGIKISYIDANGEDKILGSEEKNKNLILVDNPFNIDIHSIKIDEEKSNTSLKYFCNEGYKNYGFNDNEWKSVLEEPNCPKGNNKVKTFYKVGTKIATIKLKDIEVYAYQSNNNQIIYLVDEKLFLNNEEKRSLARPIEKIQNDFFYNLSSFEKILLNKKTKPLYEAVFEVLEETSTGYVTLYESFIFPKTYGGYNIAVSGNLLNKYIQKLYKYANLYDEIFCDNLFRSMTHESIKNLSDLINNDLEQDNGDEIIEGSDKIKKTIRLIGREFDELKLDIDAIKNCGIVKYDDNSLMPDYFLSETLDNYGWVVKEVNPFNNELNIIKHIKDIIPYKKELNSIYEGDYHIDPCTNKLIPNTKIYCNPNKIYDIESINSYFFKMLILNSKNIFLKKGTIESIETMMSLFGLKSQRMISLKLYGKKNENDENKIIFRSFNIKELEKTFQKDSYYIPIDNNTKCKIFYIYCNGNLICESTAVNNQNELVIPVNQLNIPYDYSISEYSILYNPIEDMMIQGKNMCQIDYYNSTKIIKYFSESRPYQGLLVKGYVNVSKDKNKTKLVPIDNFGKKELYELLSKTDDAKIILYPYFNPKYENDGHPYYQMNGGWLKKSHKILFKQSENKNELLNFENEGKYTETQRDIEIVTNINELINISINRLKNNDIVYVKELTTPYVFIDGIPYVIKQDGVDKNGLNREYVESHVYNGMVKFGTKLYADIIYLYNKNGELETYDLNNFLNGTPIYAYIINELEAEGDSGTTESNSGTTESNSGNNRIKKRLFIEGKYFSADDIEFFKQDEPYATNYFQIIDIFNKNKIGGNGWRRLTTNDLNLLNLQTVKDIKKGNNPHSGHLNYDGGISYLDYFTNIFKYAIENKLFNDNCFDDVGLAYNNINNSGFKSMSVFDDNKIHSFIDNKDYADAQNYYNFNSSVLSVNKDNSAIHPLQNKITDAIVNTKEMTLTFNHAKMKDMPAYYAYIDQVIINYIEQLIPSTVISNINYDNESNVDNEIDFTYSSIVVDMKQVFEACEIPHVDNVTLIAYKDKDKNIEIGRVYPKYRVTYSIFIDNYENDDNTLIDIVNVNETDKERTINATIQIIGAYKNLQKQDVVKESKQKAGPCDVLVDIIDYEYKIVVSHASTENQQANLVYLTDGCDIDVINKINVRLQRRNTQDITSEWEFVETELIENKDYRLVFLNSIPHKNTTSNEVAYNFYVEGVNKYASAQNSAMWCAKQPMNKPCCESGITYAYANLAYDNYKPTNTEKIKNCFDFTNNDIIIINDKANINSRDYAVTNNKVETKYCLSSDYKPSDIVNLTDFTLKIENVKKIINCQLEKSDDIEIQNINDIQWADFFEIDFYPNDKNYKQERVKLNCKIRVKDQFQFNNAYLNNESFNDYSNYIIDIPFFEQEASKLETFKDYKDAFISNIIFEPINACATNADTFLSKFTVSNIGIINKSNEEYVDSISEDIEYSSNMDNACILYDAYGHNDSIIEIYGCMESNNQQELLKIVPQNFDNKNKNLVCINLSDCNNNAFFKNVPTKTKGNKESIDDNLALSFLVKSSANKLKVYVNNNIMSGATIESISGDTSETTFSKVTIYASDIISFQQLTDNEVEQYTIVFASATKDKIDSWAYVNVLKFIPNKTNYDYTHQFGLLYTCQNEIGKQIEYPVLTSNIEMQQESSCYCTINRFVINPQEYKYQKIDEIKQFQVEINTSGNKCLKEYEIYYDNKLFGDDKYDIDKDNPQIFTIANNNLPDSFSNSDVQPTTLTIISKDNNSISSELKLFKYYTPGYKFSLTLTQSHYIIPQSGISKTYIRENIVKEGILYSNDKGIVHEPTEDDMKKDNVYQNFLNRSLNIYYCNEQGDLVKYSGDTIPLNNDDGGKLYYLKLVDETDSKIADSNTIELKQYGKVLVYEYNRYNYNNENTHIVMSESQWAACESIPQLKFKATNVVHEYKYQDYDDISELVDVDLPLDETKPITYHFIERFSQITYTDKQGKETKYTVKYDNNNKQYVTINNKNYYVENIIRITQYGIICRVQKEITGDYKIYYDNFVHPVINNMVTINNIDYIAESVIIIDKDADEPLDKKAFYMDKENEKYIYYDDNNRTYYRPNYSKGVFESEIDINLIDCNIESSKSSIQEIIGKDFSNMMIENAKLIHKTGECTPPTLSVTVMSTLGANGEALFNFTSTEHTYSKSSCKYKVSVDDKDKKHNACISIYFKRSDSPKKEPLVPSTGITTGVTPGHKIEYCTSETCLGGQLLTLYQATPLSEILFGGDANTNRTEVILNTAVVFDGYTIYDSEEALAYSTKPSETKSYKIICENGSEALFKIKIISKKI